jgi:hypothetical protein
MGRRFGKSLMLLTGFVLVVAACSDNTAETTTSTTIPVETTTPCGRDHHLDHHDHPSPRRPPAHLRG